MRLRLKSCDVCGAVVHKEDEAFHLGWHAALSDLLRRRTSGIEVADLFTKVDGVDLATVKVEEIES